MHVAVLFYAFPVHVNSLIVFWIEKKISLSMLELCISLAWSASTNEMHQDCVVCTRPIKCLLLKNVFQLLSGASSISLLLWKYV